MDTPAQAEGTSPTTPVGLAGERTGASTPGAPTPGLASHEVPQRQQYEPSFKISRKEQDVLRRMFGLSGVVYVDHMHAESAESRARLKTTLAYLRQHSSKSNIVRFQVVTDEIEFFALAVEEIRKRERQRIAFSKLIKEQRARVAESRLAINSPTSAPRQVGGDQQTESNEVSSRDDDLEMSEERTGLEDSGMEGNSSSDEDAAVVAANEESTLLEAQDDSINSARSGNASTPPRRASQSATPNVGSSVVQSVVQTLRATREKYIANRKCFLYLCPDYDFTRMQRIRNTLHLALVDAAENNRISKSIVAALRPAHAGADTIETKTGAEEKPQSLPKMGKLMNTVPFLRFIDQALFVSVLGRIFAKAQHYITRHSAERMSSSLSDVPDQTEELVHSATMRHLVWLGTLSFLHNLTTVLRGYVFTTVGVEAVVRDSLIELAVRSLGGELEDVFVLPRVTHVLANRAGTQKYKAASAMNIPILRVSYALACFRAGEAVPIKSEAANYIFKQFFAGFVVCTTGIADKERSKVQKIVEACGGTYEGPLTNACNVLVAAKPSGDKYKMAQQLGIRIVRINWVWDGLRSRGVTVLDDYSLPPVGEESVKQQIDSDGNNQHEAALNPLAGGSSSSSSSGSALTTTQVLTSNISSMGQQAFSIKEEPTADRGSWAAQSAMTASSSIAIITTAGQMTASAESTHAQEHSNDAQVHRTDLLAGTSDGLGGIASGSGGAMPLTAFSSSKSNVFDQTLHPDYASPTDVAVFLATGGAIDPARAKQQQINGQDVKETEATDDTTVSTHEVEASAISSRWAFFYDFDARPGRWMVKQSDEWTQILEDAVDALYGSDSSRSVLKQHAEKYARSPSRSARPQRATDQKTEDWDESDSGDERNEEIQAITAKGPVDSLLSSHHTTNNEEDFGESLWLPPTARNDVFRTSDMFMLCAPSSGVSAATGGGLTATRIESLPWPGLNEISTIFAFKPRLCVICGPEFAPRSYSALVMLLRKMHIPRTKSLTPHPDATHLIAPNASAVLAWVSRLVVAGDPSLAGLINQIRNFTEGGLGLVARGMTLGGESERDFIALEIINRLKSNIYFVNPTWIATCAKERRRVEESPYLLDFSKNALEEEQRRRSATPVSERPQSLGEANGITSANVASTGASPPLETAGRDEAETTPVARLWLGRTRSRPQGLEQPGDGDVTPTLKRALSISLVQQANGDPGTNPPGSARPDTPPLLRTNSSSMGDHVMPLNLTRRPSTPPVMTATAATAAANPSGIASCVSGEVVSSRATSKAKEKKGGSASSPANSSRSTGVFQGKVFAVCIEDFAESMQLCDYIRSNGGIIAPTSVGADVLAGRQAYSPPDKELAHESAAASGSKPAKSTKGKTTPHPSVVRTGVHFVVSYGRSPATDCFYALAPREGGGVCMYFPPSSKPGPNDDLIADTSSTVTSSLNGFCPWTTSPGALSNLPLFIPAYPTYSSTGESILLSSPRTLRNALNQLATIASLVNNPTVVGNVAGLVTPSSFSPSLLRNLVWDQHPLPSSSELVEPSSWPLCIVQPCWVRTCVQANKLLDPRRMWLVQNAAEGPLMTKPLCAAIQAICSEKQGTSSAVVQSAIGPNFASSAQKWMLQWGDEKLTLREIISRSKKKYRKPVAQRARSLFLALPGPEASFFPRLAPSLYILLHFARYVIPRSPTLPAATRQVSSAAAGFGVTVAKGGADRRVQASTNRRLTSSLSHLRAQSSGANNSSTGELDPIQIASLISPFAGTPWWSKFLISTTVRAILARARIQMKAQFAGSRSTDTRDGPPANDKEAVQFESQPSVPVNPYEEAIELLKVLACYCREIASMLTNLPCNGFAPTLLATFLDHHDFKAGQTTLIHTLLIHLRKDLKASVPKLTFSKYHAHGDALAICVEAVLATAVSVIDFALQHLALTLQKIMTQREKINTATHRYLPVMTDFGALLRNCIEPEPEVTENLLRKLTRSLPDKWRPRDDSEFVWEWYLTTVLQTSKLQSYDEEKLTVSQIEATEGLFEDFERYISTYVAPELDSNAKETQLEQLASELASKCLLSYSVLRHQLESDTAEGGTLSSASLSSAGSQRFAGQSELSLLSQRPLENNEEETEQRNNARRDSLGRNREVESKSESNYASGEFTGPFADLTGLPSSQIPHVAQDASLRGATTSGTAAGTSSASSGRSQKASAPQPTGGSSTAPSPPPRLYIPPVSLAGCSPPPPGLVPLLSSALSAADMARANSRQSEGTSIGLYISTFLLPCSLPASPGLPFMRGTSLCTTQLAPVERVAVETFARAVSKFVNLSTVSSAGESGTSDEVSRHTPEGRQPEAYADHLTRKCTHLIGRELSGDKVAKALRWKIPVVSTDWLVESIYAGCPLDESLFFIEATPSAPTVSASCASSTAANPVGSDGGDGGTAQSDVKYE